MLNLLQYICVCIFVFTVPMRHFLGLLSVFVIMMSVLYGAATSRHIVASVLGPCRIQAQYILPGKTAY